MHPRASYSAEKLVFSISVYKCKRSVFIFVYAQVNEEIDQVFPGTGYEYNIDKVNSDDIKIYKGLTDHFNASIKESEKSGIKFD